MFAIVRFLATLSASGRLAASVASARPSRGKQCPQPPPPWLPSPRPPDRRDRRLRRGLAELAAQTFVVIDSRGRARWDQGHVQPAVHLPTAEIAARAPTTIPWFARVVTSCWGPGCDGTASDTGIRQARRPGHGDAGRLGSRPGKARRWRPRQPSHPTGWIRSTPRGRASPVTAERQDLVPPSESRRSGATQYIPPSIAVNPKFTHGKTPDRTG